MKSVKIHTENSNEKKVLKETTIRKKLKKSDKVGKPSEKACKMGIFRQNRMIWQPWLVYSSLYSSLIHSVHSRYLRLIERYQ
jgi:hypothetical protein